MTPCDEIVFIVGIMYTSQVRGVHAGILRVINSTQLLCLYKVFITHSMWDSAQLVNMARKLNTRPLAGKSPTGRNGIQHDAFTGSA